MISAARSIVTEVWDDYYYYNDKDNNNVYYVIIPWKNPSIRGGVAQARAALFSSYIYSLSLGRYKSATALLFIIIVYSTLMGSNKW